MKQPHKDTRVHLVQELEKLPRTPEIIALITEARLGEFHDYKNQKYACGKIEAYKRLKAIGLNDLADRIANGEFDEQADREDILNMRKGLPERMWAAVGLDKLPDA